jgi:tRNA/rRNA methyltransferase
MNETINPDHIAVVLNRPRYPENIGSAARAMKNMGFYRLLVVDPENFDLEKIKRLATHAAGDVVENIRLFPDLQEALSSFSYVAGTTARMGSQRQIVLPPWELAGKLIPITRQNDVAIVFGSEDRGLTNEDIRLCHALINIPTANFSSLNLAQAVMVICYALFTANTPNKKHFAPRLAARHELDGMYEQIRDILVRINYILPENPDYWMNKIRFFLSRLSLRAREVAMIRGICRQIDWYGEKCRRDGRREHLPDALVQLPSEDRPGKSLPEDPEDQRNNNADNDHAGNGDIDLQTGLVDKDVSRQTAKRNTAHPRPGQAQDNQHDAGNNE